MEEIKGKTKKRKVRSDRKYKYRKKNGMPKPYYLKRDKTSPVKIWWWHIKPMSKEGIRRIPKHLRPTARKTIYMPEIRVDVMPELLSTKKNIESLAVDVIGVPGNYLLMMFVPRKNSYRVSPVKTAEVTITESSEGLRGHFVRNYRLHYYWFWKGGRK